MNEALKRVRAYQRAYSEHYRLAVNFTLLAVHTIDDIDDELLQFFKSSLSRACGRPLPTLAEVGR